MSNSHRLHLTLDVVFENAGEEPAKMIRRLERAVEECLATCGPTVLEHSLQASEAGEPPDEDKVAQFMYQRIEDGDLALEDIPRRLARYGLMDPVEFANEMCERMDLAKAE